MTAAEARRDLTTAEWKVIKIVWDLGKGMAREIYTQAGEEHGWSATTTKTLLKRLVDKGYLTTTTVGNGYVYRPAQSAITILRDAADTLLEHATRSATAPLLAHMVESSSLDEEELQTLEKLIADKKKSLQKSATNPRKNAAKKRSSHE